MTRGALPLLLLSLLGPACAGDPAGSGAECSCVAVLRLDGRLYAIADPSLLGGDPGEIVAHVARHVPCDDTPGPCDAVEPLRDGDSNFLPEGTAVHAVPGFDPSERVAVRPLDVWILLESGRL